MSLELIIGLAIVVSAVVWLWHLSAMDKIVDRKTKREIDSSFNIVKNYINALETENHRLKYKNELYERKLDTYRRVYGEIYD